MIAYFLRLFFNCKKQAVINCDFYSIIFLIMRKITKTTARAFADCKTCKLSNSCVDYGISGSMYYYLHNNCIAEYDDRKNILILEDAGRQSNTTKERLNGILDVFGLGRIFQKNWDWYYEDKNGNIEKWNGTLKLQTN